MFFIIKWNSDNDGHELLASNHKDAWIAYWAIKKLVEKQDPTHDIYLSITSSTGMKHDPLQGELLPFIREGDGKILLKKGRYSD